MVAERRGVSESTVYLVAKAFTAHGGRVEEVIARKKRATPPIEPKVTGDVEARVIALAGSPPPEGYARSTLRLLQKHVIATEGFPRGTTPRSTGSSETRVPQLVGRCGAAGAGFGPGL